MRRLLPLFFLLLVLFSFFPKVYAQTSPSILNQTTVHSQGLFDDFFAWLGNILFKNNIPDKVAVVNDAGLPINTNIKAIDNIKTNDDALRESSNQYNTAADRSTPFVTPSVDNRNFIQIWLDSLTKVVPTGTQQATNYYSSNLPFGVADKTMPTPSDENSAMAYALDCKKDSTLPIGANPDSKCIPTNRPEYVSPTPTPTETPIPTPTVNPSNGDLYGYLVPTPADLYSSYSQLPFHIPYNKKADPPEIIDAINAGLPANMNIAVRSFKSKWHTSMIDSWREVYDAAVAQGWNSAFVLSIWIEETAASDACTIGYPIIDFGVGSTSTFCNDPDKVQKFRDQLTGFLNLYGFYENSYLKKSPVTFEMFLCAYADGHYPCDFSAHPGFVYRLPRVYNCLLYPVKSNCPVGYFDLNVLPDTLQTNPTPSVNVSGLDKMFNMVSDIRQACINGIVQYTNIACLNQTANPIPQGVKSIMVLSASNYQYLQCVGFVQASELLVTGVRLDKGGNAIDFSTNVPDGYRYVSKSGGEAIKPGDLLIWDTRPYSPYGHIAKVYTVTSNYSIQLCEANWATPGSVRCDRSVPLSNSQIIGWLTPQ